MIKLTDEMRADVDNALANRTPCAVATCSARGEPNISLRGSMMVFDDEHLAYWDRTRARQLEHVAENPHLVVFYRDPARRVSYRFYGQATVHAEGPVREQVMARTVQAELDRDPDRQGVAVVVRVDRVMNLGNQVLQEREGAPPTPPRTFNLFETVYTARSIRRFRPDPVPDELLERVLGAAIQAPSGGNAQSWRFLVVRDPTLRAGIGELYRQGFGEVYPSDRLASEPDPNRRRVFRSAAHLAEHMGTEPPVLVLVCLERLPGGPPPTRGAGSSAYPAAQNLLLAARALGLGGCLTTLHMRHEEQVKELLGIPGQVDTYALIPLGYPAQAFGPLRRRPIGEVTYRDRWGQS
ncbi:MAG TPA: nitroreductase family protein [Chloroflexota bacterium]|jgi:nitroreductase|nr:nitroreductase family protein [Chloroflexota bacterium]